VPNRKVGTYVNCPRCNGRFWVAESGPKDPYPPRTPAPPPPGNPGPPASMAPLAGSLPPPGPPGAPPGKSSVHAPQGFVTPFAPPPAPVPPAPPPAMWVNSPPPPAQVAPPGRKVARCITTEASTSNLALAEDGKLPELRLEEGQQTEAKKQGSGMNPLVLVGLLCLSVAMSIALVFMGDAPGGSSVNQDKAHARFEIEDKFFLTERNAPVEPYQKLLREAKQAYSRGDRKTEKECYRKVLDLLRVERAEFDRGLTGSRSRDAELEKQVTVLMRGD
jgi:hypothetical protein